MENDAQVDASGHEEIGDSFSNTAGPVRRACDACRARKIRCNRESPCSHCLYAKIECTHADSRPKEKRTRILLTPQYERKIDQIDRRLDGVVKLLEDLKMGWTPPGHGASTTSGQQPPAKESATPAKAASTLSTPSSHTHNVPPEEDGPVVEGESSLAAHSEFANEFLRKVVGTDSLQDSSLEMRETLDALSHIVSALKQQTAASEMSYPNARPLQRPGLPNCDMPPIQKTVAVTRAAKTQYLAGAAWIYEFLPLQKFPDLCLSVYFSEDHSEADFITVNAGLYSLFTDYAHHLASAEDKEEFLGYSRHCSANLETALASLPLHLPATADMILALVFGAYHAIELSKPSLSWTLCSKASELCQTVGYHRANSLKNAKPDDAHFKSFLFWSVYFIDKSLSLRLGRSSTIQDWDISIPEPTPRTPVETAWMAFYSLWIGAARCQGNIYELLYSPDAVAQPDQVRQARVQKLASDLHDLERRTQETYQRFMKEAVEFVGENTMTFFAVSDDVLRLSLLTLVYRAAPRQPGSRTVFSADCIRAARATLERHQECMVVLRRSDEAFFPIYVHWTLLFAPFIPFIVMFCQVIETQDQNDLAHLHAFVTSIQKAPAVSEAAGKMHRLFQVLYSVALRYVEFRFSEPQERETQASAEMDTYLAALGFPPAGLGDGPQQQQQQQQQALEQQQQQSHQHAPSPLQEQQQQQQQQQAAGFGLGQDGGGVMGPDSINQMMWMGNGAQLEDWFYSNQAMMGLLQEPNFNFPDPSH